MPEAAAMPTRLVAYTNANWHEEPFQFFTGDISSAEDFAGASAKLGLRLAGQATPVTELTTANGHLVITQPNEIAIAAPLAVMQALTPGLYNFDLVVTYGSGDIENVLTGQVMIIGGIA